MQTWTEIVRRLKEPRSRLALLPLAAVLITAACLAVGAVAAAPAVPAMIPPAATEPATAAAMTVPAATALPTVPPPDAPALQPQRVAGLGGVVTPAAEPTLAPTRRPTATPTSPPTAAPTATPTPLRPTPDGVRRTARVPILMYHHVQDPPRGADGLRRDLSVRPTAFARQLNYLREQGYESITLDDLALHLTVGAPLPDKPVILTFDDGYEDAYLHAFPLLEEFGFAGTFFLTTGPIDAGTPGWLTWAQVEEMSAAGQAFQPHGYDHSDLRDRGFKFLVFRIQAAREAIEARTGKTCRFFAYPSGRYDQAVVDVLRSAHFWGAVAVEQGATHTVEDLFALRRVRIQGDDDLDRFVRKLNLEW